METAAPAGGSGLDKFFNLLADWVGYLSPIATSMLPVSPTLLMRVFGVVEMAVGLAILTRWTRLGGYVAALWLLAFAVNLVTTGRFFDIAVRDTEMALAAYVLARLTEVRSESSAVQQASTGAELLGLGRAPRAA